jgi:hypothetical protein
MRGSINDRPRRAWGREELTRLHIDNYLFNRQMFAERQAVLASEEGDEERVKRALAVVDYYREGREFFLEVTK